MNEVNLISWKWTAILLLGGGILFWIGAFTPPYKQWSTADIKEYLTIIHDHKINWYVIHGFFMAGVIITVFGIYLLSQVLLSDGKNHVLPIISLAAISLGSVFWLLNIAFRLTVTFWAADSLTVSGTVHTTFQTWMDWSNLIFAIYMVLAYLAIGCIGIVIKDITWIPAWTGWFCLIFGFAGAIGYLIRFVFFEPPLMIHLPFIILGIMILIKLPKPI